MSKEGNIDKVTDYVEDQEAETNDLTDLEALEKQKKNQQKQQVVINTADIDILVGQFEVERADAKQKLIDCNADLKKAIQSFLNA